LQALYGDTRIKILERPGKLGLGSAYIDGLQLCSGSFVILMDADLSHHPQFIPEFIK
jgi:dolichol-phosphate mannosyltransferase